jgi:hypothetical protein
MAQVKRRNSEKLTWAAAAVLDEDEDAKRAIAKFQAKHEVCPVFTESTDADHCDAYVRVKSAITKRSRRPISAKPKQLPAARR